MEEFTEEKKPRTPFLWKYFEILKRSHERFDEGQNTRLLNARLSFYVCKFACVCFFIYTALF